MDKDSDEKERKDESDDYEETQSLPRNIGSFINGHIRRTIDFDQCLPGPGGAPAGPWPWPRHFFWPRPRHIFLAPAPGPGCEIRPRPRRDHGPGNTEDMGIYL